MGKSVGYLNTVVDHIQRRVETLLAQPLGNRFADSDDPVCMAPQPIGKPASPCTRRHDLVDMPHHRATSCPGRCRAP
jgi:hypothetical protein